MAKNEHQMQDTSNSGLNTFVTEVELDCKFQNFDQEKLNESVDCFLNLDPDSDIMVNFWKDVDSSSELIKVKILGEFLFSGFHLSDHISNSD